MALPMRKIFGVFARIPAQRSVQRISHLTLYPATSHKRLLCSESGNTGDSAMAGSFDESLLKILVCPLTKQPLRYDKEKNELVSDSIGVAYPIKNGIPNLVPQDGRTFETAKETDVDQ